MIFTNLEKEKLQFRPEAEFEDCEFQDIDFSAFNFRSVSFLECQFKNCNLANQSLVNASFREVTFQSCNLIGINWCAPKRVELIKFQDCKLNFSSFQGLKLKNIQILNCLASEVDFSGSDLTFADFSGTALSDSNFEKATLAGADFRSSRDYVIDVRTTKVKGAKFSYPHVLSLISALGAEVES